MSDVTAPNNCMGKELVYLIYLQINSCSLASDVMAPDNCAWGRNMLLRPRLAWGLQSRDLQPESSSSWKHRLHCSCSCVLEIECEWKSRVPLPVLEMSSPCSQVFTFISFHWFEAGLFFNFTYLFIFVCTGSSMLCNEDLSIGKTHLGLCMNKQ